MAGYGRWFRLLEIVAAKMDNTDKHSCVYPMSWWCLQLDISPRELWNFLQTCTKLCRISVQTSPELESILTQTHSKLQSNSAIAKSELIEVFIPNLLKKRDEYSRKSGVCQDKVAQEERSKKEDKRIKIKKEDKELKNKDLSVTFMEKLKANPAYSHIDFDNEFLKMDQWLLLPKNKGRQKTPRFILNWFNKIEKGLPINRKIGLQHTGIKDWLYANQKEKENI